MGPGRAVVVGGATRAGWAWRAAAEGVACRGDFPWAELRSGCAGHGLAGRGGEARGWTRADPRCPGRGLGSRGWPGTRGRCWEAGSRSAATRATAASMRACACSKRGRAAVLSVCPPQLGNPSPDPGGEATSPRRPGVPREQPGGSAAPGVTVGSWWELLRLEPQDFKGPVSVVFTFRILAKLGEGTILPLTPSHRGRAGERVWHSPKVG